MYRLFISTIAILTLLGAVGVLLARGNVVFLIGHSCSPASLGVRPWLSGEARNWDMFGTLSTDIFWHQHGYERAHFNGVVAGLSRGDARITIGWGTCQACSTGMQHYYVPRFATIEVRMVMAP